MNPVAFGTRMSDCWAVHQGRPATIATPVVLADIDDRGIV
jgi:hypothetical protein